MICQQHRGLCASAVGFKEVKRSSRADYETARLGAVISGWTQATFKT
jgi:hypothetical protein